MQASVPRKIERTIEKIQHISLVLHPRHLETLTGKAARRLLWRVYRSQMPDGLVDAFIADGRDIINENIFVAYLAGIKKGARESGRFYASPTSEDFITIDKTQRQFGGDFEKIIRDMVHELVAHRNLELDAYLARANIIVQMGIWTAYNRGKVSEYRRMMVKLRSPLGQAASYRYANKFMFATAADDTVCDECAPLAGFMSENLEDIPEPPTGLPSWKRAPAHTKVAAALLTCPSSMSS